jgi:hypothetical protein
MTYLINTLSVLAAMFIWCEVAGYWMMRVELYLDNQTQGLIQTDTGEM